MQSISGSPMIDLHERWKGLNLRLLPIDELDVKILSQLIANCRKSNVKIARELGSSEPTVRRRIRKLEKVGLIHGYTTHVNYGLIENPVKAYITLKVDNKRRYKIVGRLREHPRALAVYRVGGNGDVFAVMLFTGMPDFESFMEKFTRITGVKRLKTQLVISPYKGTIWSGV